jgi:hypothetical protein
VAALLLWLIALAFIDVSIDEGGLHPLKVKGLDPVQMVFFWITCIGMVVAWRHEAVGGALSLGGMAAVFAIEFAMRGGTPGGLLLYLMFLPGLLFLWSAALREIRQESEHL